MTFKGGNFLVHYQWFKWLKWQHLPAECLKVSIFPPSLSVFSSFSEAFVVFTFYFNTELIKVHFKETIEQEAYMHS